MIGIILYIRIYTNARCIYICNNNNHNAIINNNHKCNRSISDQKIHSYFVLSTISLFYFYNYFYFIIDFTRKNYVRKTNKFLDLDIIY